MTDHPWWQRGVIYQIYPRSFMDSDGDGVGDLQGIIDRLDHLAGAAGSLGVDAIWISPFYRSPMADFGYDVADHTDVDPLFGDLQTFDRLVTEAHRRGLKVIVDYVPNHTSDRHPWFLESRSSRTSRKRDWYIWRDAKPGGERPNNWGSMFGGPAWTWDDRSDQYYFHQFAPGQPDLNWRNPEVRAAMLDVLRFWLDRGVDGFRMDVVYVIWKHPDMPDQPLIEGEAGRGPDDLFGRQHQIYSYDQPGIAGPLSEIRVVLDRAGAIGIAELWLPLESRMPYYRHFELPFNFDLASEELRMVWEAAPIRRAVEATEGALPPGAWPNYVLGNHDIPRLASRYGSDARARVAAMLLLTLRGTPTLYAGDEIGMTDGVIEPHQVRDPQGLILGVEHTRDIARTPMPWDATPGAGFTTGVPWLPINADAPERNTAAQATDPHSILSLYRRLLSLRRSSVSLSVGDYRSLPGPEGTFVYARTAGEERHLVALDFTGASQEVATPGAGTIVLSTFLDQDGPTGDRLQLRPDEGVLVRLD